MNETKLQHRLEKERKKIAEEHRKRKTAVKETETVEEKRARRLAKRLSKEQKRKEEKGWNEKAMGYSNVDNPFGDKNLTETFIWKKKMDKEGLASASINEIERINRVKVEESKHELEKVKKMREEREKQKAEREQEKEMMQREKEAKEFHQWNKLEDQFHLHQARQRSQIRIREGRAKAIDLLAQYINTDENDDMEIEMHEPYTYLNGLSVRELEDVNEDIKVYQKLEKGKNADYWKDLTTIVLDDIDKLRRADSSLGYSDRRDSINKSVHQDVSGILKGKTQAQLALLETDVLKKIKSQDKGVDVGFWEVILSQLKAYIAKARLRERHQELLQLKLRRLKQEQNVKLEIKLEPVDSDLIEPCSSKEAVSIVALNEKMDINAGKAINEQADREFIWDDATEGERLEQIQKEYTLGCYSPIFQKEDQLEPGTEMLDPVEDCQRLQFSRAKLKSSGCATFQLDAQMEAEAKKGMSADEASFSVEAPLEQQAYLWSDKYRPRKPRYFNRVHTGFEWNKYNQTHYDLDNPPPKIVQGYKFNIFYPDLLDSSKSPEYKLLTCDDPDFAILRFHAGPPYEDIAFKVVNREWEVAHQRGFRCQFQNGIFQLWFHFKKYRYRR